LYLPGYPKIKTEIDVTVTLTLSADIERAFLREARARGLSPDEFVTEVMRSHAEKIAGQSRRRRMFIRAT
jgi:hypothetical protein